MKYNSVKTIYKGIKYDSKAEAKYAMILEDLLNQKKLKKVEPQVAFPLENMEGKKRLRYVVDFVATDNNDNVHYLEVKGQLTPANVVKMSYCQFVYGIKITLIPTTGTRAFDTSWLD